MAKKKAGKWDRSTPTIIARIHADYRPALEKLAQKNMRSVTKEVEFAVRRYLIDEGYIDEDS